ncbi:unnamed protein product [Periconia digitata]|uniref:Uncharacterized protein n=1 Tax=Periconia digitata TaxID=1303443 RepID=A0A9W4UGI9_9PLEO|nr:unnamed protein product [Periconia digitata]
MAEPDMVLISELLEEVSRNPPAIAARKLLVEHYFTVGWLDAALDEVTELEQVAPSDPEIARLAGILRRKPQPSTQNTPVTSQKTRANPAELKPNMMRNRTSQKPPQLNDDLDVAKQDLKKGYTALRSKATNILANLRRLSHLQKNSGVAQRIDTTRIEAVSQGAGTEPTAQTQQPVSVRKAARTIAADPNKATDFVIADLEAILQQARGLYQTADDDTIRDMMVKRVQALDSNLPENLKIHTELGLMHVVHENMNKTYANDETMLGDEIVDIPRKDFYVTEDNYAWDLTELVNAIKANGGVMRNPLSRGMFTPKDVRGILMHPDGKSLAALQIQQRDMAKGVRMATIDEMDKLAVILLQDQSSDQLPSRRAVDQFLTYIATLPEQEQKAIDGLRCPATDSHTGVTYDSTIGESVRDAKGNRICFHKTGDYIQQAANHLRKYQGVPPAPKCSLM